MVWCAACQLGWTGRGTRHSSAAAPVRYQQEVIAPVVNTDTPPAAPHNQTRLDSWLFLSFRQFSAHAPTICSEVAHCARPSWWTHLNKISSNRQYEHICIRWFAFDRDQSKVILIWNGIVLRDSFFCSANVLCGGDDDESKSTIPRWIWRSSNVQMVL